MLVGWVIFIAVAYVPNLAPRRSIDIESLTLFWAFISLTQIILCDQVTIALGRGSLLRQATSSGRAWASLLCIGALSGLLLDGLGQWLGKLWIYPYWNEAFYGSTFVIGFCAYWLAIVESYVLVRAILQRSLRWASPLIERRTYEAALFQAFGMAGIALIVAAIVLIVTDYRRAGGYVFEIRKQLPVRIHFGYFLAAFIGVWLALEWVQFARGRLSLLKTVLNRRFLPLCALVVASAVSSLFWETVNSAHHFWIYTNWPLPQWQLMHIPVTVLLTWPLQYVVFLSLGFLLGREIWM
ncbi:MAG: hypothetical protein ACRD4O_05390 [Bryobacteraceae bacterium]